MKKCGVLANLVYFCEIIGKIVAYERIGTKEYDSLG